MTAKMAILTNGKKVEVSTAVSVMESIAFMLSTGHVVALEQLRILCDDPGHEMFGGAGVALARAGLISYNSATRRASIHNDISAVVEAAVTVLSDGTGVSVARSVTDIVVGVEDFDG